MPRSHEFFFSSHVFIRVHCIFSYIKKTQNKWSFIFKLSWIIYSFFQPISRNISTTIIKWHFLGVCFSSSIIFGSKPTIPIQLTVEEAEANSPLSDEKIDICVQNLIVKNPEFRTMIVVAEYESPAFKLQGEKLSQVNELFLIRCAMLWNSSALSFCDIFIRGVFKST